MKNCICYKCKGDYQSDDIEDYEGEGFCPACKEINKEIASKVDAQISVRRSPPPENPYAGISKKRKGSLTLFNKLGQQL